MYEFAPANLWRRHLLNPSGGVSRDMLKKFTVCVMSQTSTSMHLDRLGSLRIALDRLGSLPIALDRLPIASDGL